MAGNRDNRIAAIQVSDERGTAAFGRRLGKLLAGGEAERPGRRLGKLLAGGEIVGLVGDLGAGKTTMTRSIARGAGIPATTVVNSPTFTILNVYDGPKKPLLHLDLYRIEDPDELEGLGLPDLLSTGAPLVIEWFDRCRTAFPPDVLEITIEILPGDARRLHLRAGGPLSRKLLRALASRA